MMFFEPLENLNVVCAFDEGFAQISYQPSVQRRFFGYVACSWATMLDKSFTAS